MRLSYMTDWDRHNFQLPSCRLCPFLIQTIFFHHGIQLNNAGISKTKNFKTKVPFQFRKRKSGEVQSLRMPRNYLIINDLRGERGIRTPGPVTVNGFQDRRIRPLCHLSGANIDAGHVPAKSI